MGNPLKIYPLRTLVAFFMLSCLITLGNCGIPGEDSTSSEEYSGPGNSPKDDTDENSGGELIAPNSYTQLVWSDEFNEGSVPNTTKWSYDMGSPLLGGTVWGNNENQHYTNDSKNAYISGGNLVIQAIYETPAGASWGVFASSARLTTTTDSYWEAIGNSPYGFYEVRAKLACIKGSWPAIWLLGKEGNWPQRGELDIAEWFGVSSDQYTISSAIHNGAYSGGNLSSAPSSNPQFASQYVADLCTDFHRFQLEWSEDKVVMGIDDSPTLTYHKVNGATTDQWPFTQPAYMLLNVAVGGNAGGNVNPADIPQMTMLVDYVRVWKDPSAGSGNSGNTWSVSEIELPFDFETTPETKDFTDFAGGVVSVVNNPTPAGINVTSKVGKMVKYGGETWGGSSISLQDSIDFSTNKIFKLKVLAPASGTRVLLKVEDENDGNIQHSKEVSTSSSQSWEEIEFNFADVSTSQTYEKITLIFDNVAGKAGDGSATYTYYFDDLRLVQTSALSSPAGLASAPSKAQSDVISLFSDTYSDLTVNTWNADWSQAVLDEMSIAGGAVKKYSSLNYAGIEMTGANSLDLSQMTHLHIDIWTPDASEFKVKLVDFGNDNDWHTGFTEHEITKQDFSTGSWKSYDFPLTDFTSLSSKSNVNQILLSGGGATIYVDNIYFYK